MPNGNYEKSIAMVIADLKEEFKMFVSTRIAMLRSEMRGKISAWKMSAPMIIIGGVLLGTAWLLLTGALVAAIRVAFGDNPFALALALAIVGGSYLLIGGAVAILAYRELAEQGIVPKRTIKVLQEDRVWIQNEARSQS